MDELKNYWKERSVSIRASVNFSSLSNTSYSAIIEEDYAKRLAKLAKMTLGRDEIG